MSDAIEVDFPEPSDADCAADYDVLALIERAASGELGRIDGVFSASDYPGAIVAAAIATRLGLHGAKPEAVLRASHKYYSRRSQREVAPEAVPSFALVRPGGGARLPFPFPVFVKPCGLSTFASDVFESAIAIGNVLWPAVKSCAPAIDVTIGISPLGLLPAVSLSERRPPQPVKACAFEMLVWCWNVWSECE